MAVKLSAEDRRLLEDMAERGGRATSSGNRRRQGADRLVDLGLATSRSLNISDVEYEMTPLGRKALALKRHGIASSEIDNIEPYKHDDGIWYVKVSCDGDPAVMMPVATATKLAADLRAADAMDLADQMQHEAERARRFAGG